MADLLSYMTLEEKIGQMALVEKNSIHDVGDISRYELGGLLSGSGAKPTENNLEGWQNMIAGYQAEAAKTRLGIPLLYGSDAIHGHAHVPGATVFPHAIGLGAAHDDALVRAVAKTTAQELEATGVNWNYAPNLDAPRDIRWGRVYETFSDDPKLISTLGAAYVEGLQSESVVATAKHFVGIGSMQWESSLNKNFRIDQGVTPADISALHTEYLPPYKAAIDAGVLSVMIGLNTWGEKKMVQQSTLLTDVLKGDLGFKGFTVSDWYGVHEGRKNIFGATVAAVNAGLDMFMLPFDYKTFVRHMKMAHFFGLVSDERIDDAVSRILYAKFSAGLFDTATNTAKQLATPASRLLAREAVAKSQVLLKNNEVLPISPSVKTIRVAGSAADNTGKQAGAWTIEWQGMNGDVVPGATSILAGIKQAAAADVHIEYDEAGNFTGGKAALGIAVVGESPYAEGWGDTDFPVLTAEDLAAIKQLQAASEKVVVIIVSGRPLLIANEVDSWDALVAAWLPGSEGEGVADVLFGTRPFTGRLPLPWPHHSEQLPITVSGETADQTPVLFPRGFGL